MFCPFDIYSTNNNVVTKAVKQCVQHSTPSLSLVRERWIGDMHDRSLIQQLIQTVEQVNKTLKSKQA